MLSNYKILVFIVLQLILLTGLKNTLSAQEAFLVSDSESRWVDSVYKSLTQEQRVAQLMIVRANLPGEAYDPRIEDYIRKYNIGGVTFFKGKPTEQLIQTNRWQQLSKTPLFVSIDAEWGLAMRLSGTISYPLQMTLGAVRNNDLIYSMGRQIAEQCVRMGIHINFAPVIDVNNNDANPVIGMRSFGDSPETVALKGSIYAAALKDGGIIATAKHFPGHGDTQNDSHYTLPIILHSRAHLDSTELWPFKQLVLHGLDGIMTAHLNIPTLDTISNLPSSLSEKIVTGILKNEIGFKGLIVTDGLDMKGVTSVQPSGKIELMALAAGNDLLLLPENIPLAIETFLKAIENGTLPESRIEESCKKVLRYKYRAGLHTYRPSFTENLVKDLNRKEYDDLVEQLFAEAVTLVKNDNILPLKNDSVQWAALTIGSDKASAVDNYLSKAGISVKSFSLPKKASKEQIDLLNNQLNAYQHIIVNIQNTNILATKKFGIEEQSIAFINELSKNKSLIINLFSSPYALDYFKINENIKAILIAYQDRPEAEKAVAHILFGKRQSLGSLPVSLHNGYHAGHGLILNSEKALMEMPSPVLQEQNTDKRINNVITRKIDSIAKFGILKKAYPGCQIVALLNGDIIFQKSYGYLTYDSIEPVTDSTIYDLASLTKILATTLAVMKLYEEDKLALDQTLGDFFPFLKNTDKAPLKLIDILTHQSGLDGWIPFYLKTIDKDGPLKEIYSTKSDLDHPYRVAENLYLNRAYKHKIYDEIAKSKLKSKEYRYSDLGMYFVPEIIENLTNEEFDQYVERVFYEPIDLKYILFRPLTSFQKSLIAPTENDTEFRMQLLRGDVHDPGAAMIGGICGHAGLFGNAKDVSQLMQMLLNEGNLNGKNFFKPETINLFTTAPFTKTKNRRGIGFDKPPLDPKDKTRGMAESATSKSFGHTGFTGTFAWADPEYKLVVVFLSNRVYPSSKVNLLANLNIRTKIHELFYDLAKTSTVN
ncbi:MAG: hypothetical protein CVT92_06030 [Bacteroidetes bacterium HGW-Bacteroidetes-1]|jgi:beta-glucosidase-like glycosyl hydrolase/CubicO group peptidase (beta-lactamase class C family)|nr:MAG: hypothetical protein CVT92_06030 [Bacteroidetes bacterium HGW-Bacteroidetes-1]